MKYPTGVARGTCAVALGLIVAAAGCGRSTTTSVTAPTPTAAPAPAPAPVPPVPASATAQYLVTFAATWSRATHPSDFPDNAHFSGLVGGTHAAGVTFWSPGSAASVGIQAMAERGSKAQLSAEVQAAIAAGHAEFLLSGGDIPRSPGSVSLEFTASQAFRLVTLVSMVAPSPDWFVGVRDVPLFLDGAWVEDLTIALAPYDAGTDSGATFSAADVETRPRAPIAHIAGFPFLNTGSVPPLGTFRFTKLSTE